MCQQKLDKEVSKGQVQLSLAKRKSEADSQPVVLNKQIPDENRVTEQQNRNNENSNDDSLNWFDSIVNGNGETEKTIDSGSHECLNLKTPSNKRLVNKEKETKMGESLARITPGDHIEQAAVSGPQRQKAEKSTNSFLGTNKKGKEAPCPTFPDSMITERASKKWQRENIKKVHGFCTSTPDPKAGGPLASLSPHPANPPQLPARDLHASSSHSEQSARKRSRDQTKEGDRAGSSSGHEILENSKAPKLAKFSFRQKPRHVENNDQAKFPKSTCSPHSCTSNDSKGERTREERAEKNQLEQNTNVGNKSKEKQPCDNKGKEQQQNQVLSSLPTKKTKMREETLNSPNTNKVSSDTLAKLARFSFVPRHESKPDRPASFNTNSNDKERPGQQLKTQAESAGCRRRCFELGKASTVPGKSLFSITDFDDSVLDLDLDEEFKEKFKS